MSVATGVDDKKIPKRVFIVPYRDRIQQKFFFCKQMEFILEGSNDYEILFVHQCDSRNFNRGAMKNIGFLAIKEKYPENYKEISFIFHDVDTLPFHKLFEYETVEGTIRHYYGFETALGGIVVIKGSDFELINGFPNYWGWGMEDASLQKRCLAYNLQIDRSNFYTIGSPEILQLFDGVSRLISKRDPQRMKTDNGQDGLRTVHKLLFSIDLDSLNPNDNKYTVDNDKIFIVNVTSFMTMVRFEGESYYEYDLREPASKVVFPENNITLKTQISPEEWKNIPYNPAADERVLKIQQQRAMQKQQHANQQQHTQKHRQSNDTVSPPSIYAPNYAKFIGVRPKALTSVNIGLGGVR